MTKTVQWTLVALFAALVAALVIGIAWTQSWKAALTFFQTAIVPMVAVALGAWLTQRANQSSQKLQLEAAKVERRSNKFEDFITAVHETKKWIEKDREHVLFGGAEPTWQFPPVNRAHVLAAVYFPSLVSDVDAYDLACTDYLLWVRKAKKKHLDGDANFTDGMKEAGKAYAEAYHAMVEVLTTYASKEFQ